MISVKLTINYKLLLIGIIESRHIYDSITRLPFANISTSMAGGVALF